MSPEEKLAKIEQALDVFARQQLSPPTGGAVIDIQARAVITLLIKAIKDIAISL